MNKVIHRTLIVASLLTFAPAAASAQDRGFVGARPLGGTLQVPPTIDGGGITTP